ncbi:MAG: helix-turn-helix domain-containing protein [Chitinophagaceae bacterium]|nr:helix-turn-helix domain-containing protein [Chitinophagaceae bacterium]
MTSTRNDQIFQQYLELIDKHLEELLKGDTDTMLELQDFAKQLFIHPTHLSNVVKELTGHHPCYFYEKKLLITAKRLLDDASYSIAGVAAALTFDPSNFTKWFKAFAGVTPSQYRKGVTAANASLDLVALNTALFPTPPEVRV